MAHGPGPRLIRAQLPGRPADPLLMEHRDRETRPWGEDEDTLEESVKDIGEQPTLRWLRVAGKADEPAPATLRWG